MENVYYPYMSTGSNLKNIGLNEMTGVKQLLLRRGSNKFVKWIQLLLTSAHELGMNHNNATALYWKTVELIEHAILVRQNGSFSFIPTPFFFPIWLKIQVFDVTASPYRATELIAYTGPKDEEIHVFHRLLSTRYRGKYNLTIKKLGTIIREAKHLSEEDWRKKHNQRPNQRPNSPNSPSNKSGSIKRNTPNNVDTFSPMLAKKLKSMDMGKKLNSIKIAAGVSQTAAHFERNARAHVQVGINLSNATVRKDLEKIKNALRHHGMYVFPVYEITTGSETRLLCKAGIVVDW